MEGDGESLVFFRSRPLLLNSALSATNWRSGKPSRQSLAKCIFSDSLSPMLLKNTRDSPVQLQTKQNAPGKYVGWTLIAIVFCFRNWYYLCKSTNSISPLRILWLWEIEQENFYHFLPEALGKVSPKSSATGHWQVATHTKASDAYGDFGAKAFLSVNLVAVSG